MRITPLNRTCLIVAGIVLALLVGSACENKTPTKPSTTESTTTTSPPPSPPPSVSCSATLQLSQSTVDLKQTQVRLTVTAPEACQWSVTTPTWVSVVSKYGGTGTYVGTVGTGTVTLWLQVASSTSARDADIYVGTSSVHLYQERECSLTLQPTVITFDQAGGRGLLDLSTTLPTRGWSVEAPAWIRVQPSSGTGSARITVDVSASDSTRTGLISSGGYSVGVTQTPTGVARQFAFVSLLCGTIRPGESKPGLCWFVLQAGTNPTSDNVRVVADMRAVGGHENWQLLKEMGTGGLGFSADVHVPADLPSGLKLIPLTAYDGQGRTATATATIEVLPPK